MSKTEQEREKQRMVDCKELIDKIGSTECPNIKLDLLKKFADRQYYIGLGDTYDNKVLYETINYDRQDELEGG